MGAMGAQTAVSEEIYLTTAYDPDCDYVNGEVLERNVGEERHSFFQGMLTAYFLERRRQWNIMAYPEQRVRVAAGRYRVPDLCVVRGGPASEPILTQPPFLCVEILSSEDRLSRIQERIDDYLAMGVETVWVVDPVRQRGWMHSSAGIVEAKDGIMRTTDPAIQVPLVEVFQY